MQTSESRFSLASALDKVSCCQLQSIRMYAYDLYPALFLTGGKFVIVCCGIDCLQVSEGISEGGGIGGCCSQVCVFFIFICN